MAKLPLYDGSNKVVGEIDVRDDIFFAPVKEHLIHDAVKVYLANQRQGTASTKTRSFVSGGGRKPWKQKGTGRARVGSIRSPLFRKGAILFGPQPRDYSMSLPKKIRRAAIKSALSKKNGESKLFVLDDVALSAIKTKQFASMLKSFEIANVLFVLPERNINLELSGRNIPNVKVIKTEGLNVYDIIKHDCLMIQKSALAKIEGVIG